MTPQAINRELAHALRLALPYVKVAATGGSYASSILSTAMRALVDADAEHARAWQAEFGAVNRLVEASYWRNRPMTATKTRGLHLCIGGFGGFGDANPGRSMDRSGTTATARGDAINAADAKMQAARAVRPGEGYAPATPPAKGCDCDVCQKARIRMKHDALMRAALDLAKLIGKEATLATIQAISGSAHIRGISPRRYDEVRLALRERVKNIELARTEKRAGFISARVVSSGTRCAREDRQRATSAGESLSREAG